MVQRHLCSAAWGSATCWTWLSGCCCIILALVCPSAYHGRLTRTYVSRTHTDTFNGPLSGTTQVSQYTHTHTHPFNGPFSGTTLAGFYWSKRQWVAVASAGSYASLHYSSRQITMPAPHHSFFYSRMPFLPPNQQRQSTEGTAVWQTVTFNTVRCPCNGRVCEVSP